MSIQPRFYYAIGYHLPNGRMATLNLPEFSANHGLSELKVMAAPSEFDPKAPDAGVWESDRTLMVEKIIEHYSKILKFICGFGYEEDCIVLWSWNTSLGCFDETAWAQHGRPLWVAFRHRKSMSFLAGTNFAYDRQEITHVFASRTSAPKIFPGKDIDREMYRRNLSFFDWEMVDVSEWFLSDNPTNS